MSIRTVVLSAALLAAPAALVAQSGATDAPAPAPQVHPKVGNETELGRQYTHWLYTAQFDSLFAHMREETRTALGSPDEMAAKFDGFTAQMGEETKLLGEMVVMRKGKSTVLAHRGVFDGPGADPDPLGHRGRGDLGHRDQPGEPGPSNRSGPVAAIRLPPRAGAPGAPAAGGRPPVP